MPCQNGQRLYRHIYLVCKEENSSQRHFDSLFSLLVLLSVELANEEVVVDLVRLALALQVRHARPKGRLSALPWISTARPEGGFLIGEVQEGHTPRFILELERLRPRGSFTQGWGDISWGRRWDVGVFYVRLTAMLPLVFFSTGLGY